MSTVISIRLSKKLAEQLDRIAKETKRSRSFIIQKALESYIEDFADWQIAFDRFHDKSDTVVSGKGLRESLVFPNRSKAIQEAVEEKLSRINRSRLARECAKLYPVFEKALAEEGFSREIE